METKHTETPWHLVDNGMYFEVVVPWKSSPENIDQYCPQICSVSYEGNDGIVGRPNAEFIVRACNAHDDLVKALQDARSELQGILLSCASADEEGAVTAAIKDIDAALAKAGA